MHRNGAYGFLDMRSGSGGQEIQSRSRHIQLGRGQEKGAQAIPKMDRGARAVHCREQKERGQVYAFKEEQVPLYDVGKVHRGSQRSRHLQESARRQ